MYATSHETILVVVQVLAFVFLAYIFHASNQARMSRKHELSKRMLDKMSSEEFLDLLKSDEGRRSIERLVGSHKPPDEWARDAVRRAMVLLCTAPALIVVYMLTDFSGHEIFFALGSIAAGVGVGYLIAAALTRGRARRA